MLAAEHWRVLSAARLRAMIPDTMNVEVRPADGFVRPQRAVAGVRDALPIPQLNFYEFARANEAMSSS